MALVEPVTRALRSCYGSEGLFVLGGSCLPASRYTRAVVHNRTDNTWTDVLSVRYEHVWEGAN